MASKRKFRLEPVLRLRQQREKQLQGQLADVLRKQVEQQFLLTQMQGNRQAQIDLLTAQLSSDRVQTAQVQFGHAYLERLQSLIDRQANVVKQAARATDQKRAEVTSAMKDRKVIEKLKEHWWGDLLEADRQRDLKMIDEVSNTQFNRRRLGI
ncbi:MAG: flagellar export protein FliJ [Chloroflexota bacterium]